MRKFLAIGFLVCFVVGIYATTWQKLRKSRSTATTEQVAEQAAPEPSRAEAKTYPKPMRMNIDDLLNRELTDTKAMKEFRDKRLFVAAVVLRIGSDKSGSYAIVDDLEPGQAPSARLLLQRGFGASVTCYFLPGEKDKLAQVQKGDGVTIEGTFTKPRHLEECRFYTQSITRYKNDWGDTTNVPFKKVNGNR